MPIKLSEKTVRELPLGSGATRDTEVKGLMVVCNAKSKSYAVQGDLWRDKRFVKAVRASIGRTDRVTLRDARVRARELMAAIARGEDPNASESASGMTLEDAWELYKRGPGRDLTPRTIEWYSDHVDGGLRKWKNRPLSEIARSEARELHEKLTRTSGPYSANGCLRAFRAIWNEAMRVDDTLPPNPAIAVHFNRERARNWALGADELPKLWTELKSVRSPVHRAGHAVLLFTGLRCGSAMTARREHLDAAGNLHIPSPKGGADRAFTLPLSKFTVELLDRLGELTAAYESSLIFPSESSKSGHAELRRTDGLPSPHAYRHTYRTLGLEAGIDFTTMSLLLNHKLPSVSFNYITRDKLLGHLREAQERMTAYLQSKIGRFEGLL
ncbi:MAG: tyrosine-type recombinase/integrase [Reyranellaceae bacterium]